MNREIQEYPLDEVEVTRLLWYGGNAYDPAGMYATIKYNKTNYQVFLAYKDTPPEGGKEINIK